MADRGSEARRTFWVGDLADMPAGRTVRLAGRLVAWDEVSGLGLLADETGRAAVRIGVGSVSGLARLHDIVSVGGLWTGQEVEADAVSILHRATAPPPWELKGVHQPERLREAAEARKRLYAAVRAFFDARGFIEVETPLLLADPALQGHIAELTTTCRRPDGPARRLYLSTSPEHAMKRLLASGLERIYQMAPFFRDGELTGAHAPAFTGLEWYEAYTDYRHCMTTTEALVAAAAEAVAGSLTITYQGEKVDLKPPWERLTVVEAFARELSVELDPAGSAEEMRSALRQRGVAVEDADDWEACFFKAYIERIEPTLGRGRPTLLTDWPIALASMSRPKPQDPRWCERFELYVAGLELGNAFSELTDPAVQRARFEAVAAERPGQKPDERLLEAMAYGLPPSSGLAMGLDRLLMLLTDAPTIADVLLFPPHQEWSGGE